MRFPRHPIVIARNLIHGPPPPGIPKRALERYLPRDAVLLEAGAHRGVDTLELSRMWPKGQIHAFEPVPAVYEHLRSATAELPNVKTYPVALGDTVTTAPMYVGSGLHDGSSSLLAPKDHLNYFPEITFDHTVSVDVTTIGAWVEQNRIERIDGMWLDMQGYELAALKAAGPVLATVKALVIEMSVTELYAGLALWPEVRGWLQEHGFRIAIEDLYHEACGDALLVRG